MSTSSSVLKKSSSEHLVKLAEIIKYDFVTKSKKTEYVAFDAMSLSFPELVKKSGVVDIGGYLGKFHPNVKSSFWSTSTFGRSYQTISDLDKVRRYQYTTAWELLSVFIENKKKWRRFLMAGRRIVSCSNDVFHGQGVFSSLSARGDRIVFNKISVDGNTRWSNNDYFLIRLDPS